MQKIKLKNKFTLTAKEKVAAVLLLLLGIRLLSDIPVPFTDSEYLETLLSTNSSLNFYNAMTGGGLGNMSVGALSITPFITSSIIIQLLGVVFPRLHEMQTGMDDERKKIRHLTVALSIALAVAQALAMAVAYGKNGAITPYAWYSVLIVTVCWAGGSAVCAVCGEFIQERYSFNGSSLILTMNILSSLLSDFYSAGVTLSGGEASGRGALYIALFIAGVYLVYCFVVLITKCEKRLPVTHSGKSIKGSGAAPKGTLPIKMCPGGVVPVIFTSTILSVPSLFASFSGNAWTWTYFFNSSYWFSSAYPQYTVGVILYIALIIGFTYFYAPMVFNPSEVADNLRKNGAVIPGVRPGQPTAEYLQGKLTLMLLIGALAMCFIAVIPMVVSGVLSISDTAYLGTSVIICVGVILETKDQLKAEAATAGYRRSLLGR